ncbi:SHOCT domain-containing protein [Streptomyces rhizosphaericus]|nr:SHOCT domain-containing protein [Streptomyces rhizosphaericus]
MMVLSFVLFWALVIMGLIALIHYVRDTRRSGPTGSPAERGWGHRQERAEDVLAERFAHGEIDEDEYKRRLALLRER